MRDAVASTGCHAAPSQIDQRSGSDSIATSFSRRIESATEVTPTRSRAAGAAK
ncbi:MAG: hypothetical protein H6710_02270 [Myxococcales bacterium]|nr:hypothetical protein [Myxococcales bacterium]